MTVTIRHGDCERLLQKDASMFASVALTPQERPDCPCRPAKCIYPNCTCSIIPKNRQDVK